MCVSSEEGVSLERQSVSHILINSIVESKDYVIGKTKFNISKHRCYYWYFYELGSKGTSICLIRNHKM